MVYMSAYFHAVTVYEPVWNRTKPEESYTLLVFMLSNGSHQKVVGEWELAILSQPHSQVKMNRLQSKFSSWHLLNKCISNQAEFRPCSLLPDTWSPGSVPLWCSNCHVGWMFCLRQICQYSKSRIPSPLWQASGSQNGKPTAGYFSESSLRCRPYWMGS